MSQSPEGASMPDHEGDQPRDPRIPAELFRSTELRSATDLEAALGGLDRATRNFTRRLDQGNLAIEQSRLAASHAVAGSAIPAPRTAAGDPHRPHGSAPPAPFAAASFERHMHEAEQEARMYLEGAKRRADSLVATMIGAVEHEAAEIRRTAEEGIRSRWRQVEVDAGHHVENARRIAERMVAERQQRISALSDGITGRATALTAGMDDAEQVRTQFDSFVRALSAAADRIAQGTGTSGTIGELREPPRSSALAA
jgi:hypothetical protein